MPIETLNKIFIDYCKVLPSEGNELHILEPGNIKGLKKVVVKGIPAADFIAVKLDQYPNVSRYFTTKLKNINKGCDLLLIVKFQDKFYTFLIELKSYLFKRKPEVEPKFLNSKLFTEYVVGLAEKNFGVILPMINFAYVLFYLKNRKGRMRTSSPINIEKNGQKYNTISVLEIYRFSGDTIQIQLPKLIQELE